MIQKYFYLIIIFLIITSYASFGRIANNDFINFDDNTYITENSFIQQGFTCTSIKWAFVNRDSTMWQPMTWISLMVDWKLFGANASGYHIINLLFHIGSVIFLFLFLARTTDNIWAAAFAAAFFALHPLRVESVAWVAERKDVLSMFFGMGCLYAYSFYVDHLKPSRYFICLILFALALMSKSMLITLPFIMLLLDYWPLKRFEMFPANNGFALPDRLLWEKVPFFFLSIVSSILTVWAQYKDSSKDLTFPLRLINAAVSYVSYLSKIFLPVDLAVYYPFVHSFPLWKILGSVLILLGLTFVAFRYAKKLPFLFVGWIWYLGALVPVSGLVPVNTPISDHYTYLPSIGIALMLAWGIPDLIKNENTRKKILFPASIATLFMLAVLTWHQCGYWKNNITLFNHALRITKDNFLAHNNLAVALAKQGKNHEAIKHYNKAIAIKPNIDFLYFNRGTAYVSTGQYQLAIEDFNHFISLKPENVIAYISRGIAYAGIHQYQKAIEDFNTVISMNKNYSVAYHNRSLTYFNLGKKDFGCQDAQKACKLGNCKALELAKNKDLCR
jgi:tetratricopeptide (TPR) repeat protein